jgi:hypothetical protein
MSYGKNRSFPALFFSLYSEIAVLTTTPNAAFAGGVGNRFSADFFLQQTQTVSQSSIRPSGGNE